MFFFGGGIQGQFNRAMFNAAPRRDQDAVMQHLYDEKYSVPEIEKFLGVPGSTIYSRINANRGRGPSFS